MNVEETGGSLELVNNSMARVLSLSPCCLICGPPGLCVLVVILIYIVSKLCPIPLELGGQCSLGAGPRQSHGTFLSSSITVRLGEPPSGALGPVLLGWLVPSA